jgi:hypothetical protein
MRSGAELMNKGAGIAAAVIGAIGLIGAALVTGVFSPDTPVGPGPAPPPPGQERADVTIRDELGDTQYSEALNIKIDGESKGDLIIERNTRPYAEMTVSLAPGSHNYEISGTTQMLDTYGNVQQFPVAGEGELIVSEDDPNQSYDLRQTGTQGNTLIAELDSTS